MWCKRERARASEREEKRRVRREEKRVRREEREEKREKSISFSKSLTPIPHISVPLI